MGQRLLRNFQTDTRGSVAIIFALLVVVILGIAGVAVDFSRAASLKTRLDKAADASVLAAARQARMTMAQGGTAAEAQTAATDLATNSWNVNTSGVEGRDPSPNIEVTQNGQAWSVKLSYNSAIKTSLAAVLGIAELQVKNSAQASLGGSLTYIDFNLLLDVSQSMGLAATQTGITQMITATGCQFGCHVTGESAYYDYAKANGIPMRIDILRDATDALISRAMSLAQDPDQFKVGITTFDRTSTQLATLSSNLSSVRSAAAGIDLPTSYDGTQTDDALRDMNTQLTASQDGTAADKPIKFVFLVTDGVQDGFYTGWMPPTGLPTSTPGFGIGMESPVSPTACDDMKAKGVTVAILYTTYVPFGGWQYSELIGTFADTIVPNLKACASPDFFFQATEASEINAAMQAMFAKAVTTASKLRLSK